MTGGFAIVPVEACADPRLTKMQLRVLIALLSFRAKNTDTVWPKRSKISQRCGYSESVISRVTTQLCELGWLVKVGNGGFSKASEYRITVPKLVTVDSDETVTEPVTVDDNKTVTTPVTVRGGKTVTEPVTVTELETVTEPDNKTVTTPVTKRLPNWSGAKNIPRTYQGTDQQSDDCRTIFEHWQRVMAKPRSRYSNDKRDKIRARLRDGFTVAELCQAVDGCASSSHHMGQNEAGKRYDSIELIFRNASKTEEFIEMAERKQQPTGGLEI